MDVFSRYAPFIQDYIYDHGWQNLRSIQVAAATEIFGTQNNVLLSASTASGKTEAAFFPILTELAEHPSESIGCLYIAPLKALINDQYARLISARMRISRSGAGMAMWPSPKKERC